MNGVRAHIFHSDTNYDTSNYSDPIKNYINNYNIDITYNTQKETHLYFQYLNLTSDDTYFFLAPCSRQFSGVALNYFAERPAFRESYSKNVIIMNIRTDKNQYSFKRNYSLFSQTVANIGAILNVCLLFFKLLIFSVSRIHFFTKLVNNVQYLYYNDAKLTLNLPKNFNSHGKNPQASNHLPNKKPEFWKNTEESKINLNSLEEGEPKPKVHVIPNIILQPAFREINVVKKSELKENEKIFLESFKISNYKHQENFLDIVVLALFPCSTYCNKTMNRRSMLIDYSKRYIYRYSDFFKFISNFVELNIMKKLILTKKELELLDIAKNIVLVKNVELAEILDSMTDKEFSSISSPLNDKIKLHRLGDNQHLREIIKSILENSNRTHFENNFVERFTTLF